MITKKTLDLVFFSIFCMFKVITTDEMGFRSWRVLILDFTDCKIALPYQISFFVKTLISVKIYGHLIILLNIAK